MDLEELTLIILNTLYVSLIPTILASAVGVPLGAYLVLRRRRISRVVEGVFNGMVGMPTVLLGLLLYVVLAKSGPLGWLNLMYTLNAVVIGHTLLIIPLITAFTIASLSSISPTVREAALTLGISELRSSLIMIREGIHGVISAVVAGFSRAVGELGIALMLGGDIRFKTRVLTTAVAFETMRGNLEDALALGAILLAISLSLGLAMYIAVPQARALRG